MLVFWIIVAYIVLSIPVYFIMDYLYHKKNINALPNVKHRWLWWTLQFTWALPTTIIGCIVALVLICCKKKPVKYGWCYCFEFNVKWGLELGIFFIAPPQSTSTKNHEHGHAIQNIYLGPFALTCVSIPSFTRFWIRAIIKKLKPKTVLKSYDSIWFEGQATQTGTKFIEELKR